MHVWAGPLIMPRLRRRALYHMTVLCPMLMICTCTRACACTSCACTIHSLVHVCMLWWPVEQDRPASGQDEGRLLLRCREERAAKGMLLPTLHRPNLRLHAPISTRPYRAGHRRALRQPRLRHRSSLPKLYYICAPGLQCSSLSESWPCGPLARPQHTLRHRRLTRAAHTVVILKGCHRTRSLMFLHSCRFAIPHTVSGFCHRESSYGSSDLGAHGKLLARPPLQRRVASSQLILVSSVVMHILIFHSCC